MAILLSGVSLISAYPLEVQRCFTVNNSLYVSNNLSITGNATPTLNGSVYLLGNVSVECINYVEKNSSFNWTIQNITQVSMIMVNGNLYIVPERNYTTSVTNVINNTLSYSKAEVDSLLSAYAKDIALQDYITNDTNVTAELRDTVKPDNTLLWVMVILALVISFGAMLKSMMSD